MVRFGLANELLKAQRFPEAAAALEEYLQRAQDEGAAYGMLARAYEQTGQRAEARAAARRALELQPGWPAARQLLESLVE